MSSDIPPGINWRQKKENWFRAVLKKGFGKNTVSVAGVLLMDTWTDDCPAGQIPGTYSRGSERLARESGISFTESTMLAKVSVALKPLKDSGLLVELSSASRGKAEGRGRHAVFGLRIPQEPI